MAHFFKNGNSYMVAPAQAVNMTDTLPAGNYVIKLNPMTGFYLEIVESFSLPCKVYGRTNMYCERILNTFRRRSANTGVLLVGEKGSGKTLLARKISRDSGRPVLVINSQFTGDDFNSFLSSITQPCVVFFDEFEKIYDKDHQEKILTLLDGTYQSNKLFLITSNDKWRIDTNMRNRPGRIFYLIEFSGLDEQFIREYCNDSLAPEALHLTDRIVQVSSLFSEFNFDMLVSFVEEVNRYNEDPKDLMALLNCKPEYSADISYNVSLFLRDIQVIPAAINTREVCINTSTDEVETGIYFYWSRDIENEREVSTAMSEMDGPIDVDKLYEWVKSGTVSFGRPPKSQSHNYNHIGVGFYPDDITQYDTVNNQIVYVNDEKFKCVLTKIAKKSGARAYAL
jgi:SpoVK/Ycf46/Vps4 family AAA+-type ATPase